MTLTAPCAVVGVAVRAAFPLTHVCPFRDETDHGQIEVAWTTDGCTLELHALRAWLAGFATDRITHEDITGDIQDHLAALPGIIDVRVVTTWDTAGATVEVRGAVFGEPVHPGGA